MICYKDKTFCNLSNCKDWNGCHRAFTEEEKVKAQKWWGDGDTPVCFFADKPKCFKEVRL